MLFTDERIDLDKLELDAGKGTLDRQECLVCGDTIYKIPGGAIVEKCPGCGCLLGPVVEVPYTISVVRKWTDDSDTQREP